MTFAQLAILIPALLAILVAAGLLLRKFRNVNLKWWLIRSLVAIVPVGVGFGLVYSLHAWNRNGLLLISSVALVATLLNWRVAKGVADQCAPEYLDQASDSDY